MNLDIMSLMAASAAVTDGATTQAGASASATDVAASLPAEAQFASILQSLKDESASDLALDLPATEAALSGQPGTASADDLDPALALSSPLLAGGDGRTLPLDGNGLPVADLPRGNPTTGLASNPAPSLSTAPAGPAADAPSTGWFSASSHVAVNPAAQPASGVGVESHLAANATLTAPAALSQQGAPVLKPAADTAAQSAPAAELGELDDLAPGLAAARATAAPSTGLIKEGRANVTTLHTGLASLEALTGAPLSRQPSELALAQTSRTPGDALAPQLAAVNLAQPGWDRAMSQRLVMMASRGMESAELRLDPPQLGAVQVKLAMQGDQAQLLMQVGNPAAREALEQALPRLREMLGQEGLQLDNAEVTERHAGEQRTAQHDQTGRDDNGDAQGTMGEERLQDSNVETLTLAPGRIYERV